MYYWEVTFDNGKTEYWQSKKANYNFTKLFKEEAKVHVVKAKPLTKLVYLWKKRKQRSFTVTLEQKKTY